MIAWKFLRGALAAAALVWCGSAQADIPVVSYGKVYVQVADDCAGMGTVSGGTTGLLGWKKTTIKATPTKGHAFDGWYLGGKLVSREASYTLSMGVNAGDYDTVTYVARFIAARDDWLDVDGVNAYFDVGESLDGRGNLGAYFSIESGSSPTIKVSGLPSGVKFDAKSQTFSGAPTKRGVYYVTCAVQNGNGYKKTGIAVWNVGGASNGDYDDIGLAEWFDLDNLCHLATGNRVEEFCTNLKAVSGLPTGMKFHAGSYCDSSGLCTACSGFISGTPTKVGAFKVTFSDYSNSKAVRTLVVEDGGSGYIEVDVGAWYEGRGTVSGSGVYTAGASVKLSAKPASGYYFAGWYEDSAYERPFSRLADWRKANDSFVFGGLGDDGMCLYARFISKYDDDISIESADSWNVNDDYSYDYKVLSATLPTDTVKGLPSGIKWDKDGRRFYVSDRMKIKPGTTMATITTKNLSGRTATKDVRIVVPNLQSWVFDGIDYSDSAYRLTTGVSDACVTSWFSFGYNDGYKVTASGLPPGMKYLAEDGYIAFRGTPTKAGTYTVTLTAKRGTTTEKATFTVNVDPLPEYAVGTFNGLLYDEDDEIVGSFVFTAAENGKQSVKVVTALGTMSLSASGWNCYDESGNPVAYFYKSSKDEYFSFDFTPAMAVSWDCEHQLEGSLTWRKTSKGRESEIEASIYAAQRNPFVKAGSVYAHPAAVNVAESFASEYKSKKMVILWDSDRYMYYLECAECCLPGYDYGTVTLKVDKNGVATISGKMFNSSFSTTSMLMFDTTCGDHESKLYGEHCHAIFTPVLKLKVCPHSVGTSGSSCTTENEFVPIFWEPLGR